jgi:hypothetical protein
MNRFVIDIDNPSDGVGEEDHPRLADAGLLVAVDDRAAADAVAGPTPTGGAGQRAPRVGGGPSCGPPRRG